MGKEVIDFLEIKKIRGREVLIMGAGGSVRKYKDKILSFINDKKLLVIGLNHITDIYVPDFHFWANKPRFKKFGKFINPKSELILGTPLCLERVLIRRYWNRSFYRVQVKKVVEDHYYKDGCFYGFYHCIGNIAIHMAHLLGASKIYVVGTDGYTLYDKEDLLSKKENHHCWGEGYSDQKEWEWCCVKDKVSYDILRKWSNRDKIEFTILTPTVYKDFYNPTILGIEE